MAAKRILAAATYFGVALFLSIAFVSYDGVHAPDEMSVTANLGGAVGEFLADALIMSFGVGAFGLSFFLLFVGYSVLVERPLGNIPVKCIGALMTMITIAVIVQSLHEDAGYARSVYPLGGVTGEYCASGLHHLFGGAGTALILFLATVAGVLLATDVFLFQTVVALPKLISEIAHGLRSPFHRVAAATASGSGRVDVADAAPASRRRAKKPKPADEAPAAGVLSESEEAPKIAEDARPEALAADQDDADDVLSIKPRGRTRTKPDLDLGDLPPLDDAAPEAPSRKSRKKSSTIDEGDGAVAVEPAHAKEIAAGSPSTEPPTIDDMSAAEADAIVDGPEKKKKRERKKKPAADDALLEDGTREIDDEEPISSPVAAADADPLDDDFGAGIDEYAAGGADAMDAMVDDADDGADLSMPEKRPEPIIRTSKSTRSADGIEILKISRSKHLEGKEMYALPPLSLLEDHLQPDNQEREEEIRKKARRIEEALNTFGITAQVVEISRGPTITIYEMELAAGTKVKQITALADDISMALRAQTIRIVAPIPGKSTVGIEIPNELREKVTMKELACSELLTKKHFAIPLLLGKDAAGNPLIEDLASMPHLLIAGQTGSGKSVCLNSLIASILLTKYPEEVRLVLIDPKMVELRAFREVPHLYTPVVTDMKKAPKVLEWACTEMDQRYELLAAASVRDIRSFNELGTEEVKKRLADHFVGDELDQAPTFLPYIVVIIDELADLMMLSAKEIEGSVCRLAQKSRAVGIHVILATQRPSVDVITGLIKSNMPSRISFRVASKIDSRTILDQMGAERLVGHGDMLFLAQRAPSPIRCQATLVSDREIENLVKYIKDVAQPEYSAELTEVKAPSETGGSSGADRDPLYQEAVRFVLETRRGSVSMLQRKFEIGYTRAARLVDFMAEDGIVGEFKGSKSREVIKTLEEWESEQGAE